MKKSFRRITPILCCVMFSIAFASAEESAYFSFAPFALVPLGQDAEIFDFGLGGSVAGHFPLGFADLEATVGLDYQNAFLKAGAGNLSIIRAMGGGNWTFLRGGAFSAGLWARGGAYMAMYETSDPLFNPAAAAGLRFDLRIAKGVSLALEPGYDMCFAMGESGLSTLLSGFTAGARVFIEPSKAVLGTRQPKLRIEPPVFQQVFPVSYKYYDKNPLGTVRIVNDEAGTITDVKVGFIVPSYMQGETTIASISRMRKGEAVEVPITALFDNEVLRITEPDTVQAQIRVTYASGKDGLRVEQTASLRIYGRNTIVWDDDRRAAAFVTANDPTVKKFASNAVSSIGPVSVGQFTEPVRNAVALASAIKLYGVAYKIDPSSSYQELSKAGNAPDYLQFPVQTLDYRTGDCDDMSILFTAMLESVGVEAAFVTVPGHIFTAFKVGLPMDEAEKLFSNSGDLIADADRQAWMPIETTVLDKGFLAAWTAGAKHWRESEAMKAGKLLVIREAWKLYEATWFGGTEQQSLIAKFPKSADISRVYKAAIRQAADRELAPFVDDLGKKIKAKPTGNLYNRLGVAYARFGLLEEAEAEFKRAIDLGNSQGALNLGHLQYLRGDYKGAMASYERALAKDPESAVILVALARARFELEEWGAAKKLYEKAQAADARYAKQYAYLGGASSATARATDQRTRQEIGWDQWGE